VARPEGFVHTTLAIEGKRLGEPAKQGRRVDLGGAMVLPALVNAHDHLELDGLPRTGRRAGYRNALEWFDDVQRLGGDPEFKAWLAQPLAIRLAFSGFLNLWNGCLTVAHHNPYYWRHFLWGYPVEVVRRYGWCHSLAMERDPGGAFRRTPPGAPFILHFAEGIDQRARREIERVEELGLLCSRTVLVHGVGLPTESMPRLAASGAGLVWCPGSNFFLFGRTLAAREALAASIPLALGSDSTLSGEGGLLRELSLARETSGLSGLALLRLVTEAPARMLGLVDRGALVPGKRADLLVLHPSIRPEGFCPSHLKAGSIGVIFRAGRPLWAQPLYKDVFEKLARGFGEVEAGRALGLLARPYLKRFRAVFAREETRQALRRLDFDSPV
jgi:hypothetical protein